MCLASLTPLRTGEASVERIRKILAKITIGRVDFVSHLEAPFEMVFSAIIGR